MGARLRAEIVLSTLARALHEKGSVTIEEIAAAAGAEAFFVAELLESIGARVEQGAVTEPLNSLLLRAWLAGYDIVTLALQAGWSDFEELVVLLLREAGYGTARGVRFKARGRQHEVDVLAYKSGLLLCIDCKRWQRLRESALKKMAEAQAERCSDLAAALEAGAVHAEVPFGDYELFPVVVSLHEPATRVHSNTILAGLRGLSELASEDVVRALALGVIKPIRVHVPRKPRLL